MFRRFLTLLALLAISTTSVNRITYATEFTSSNEKLKSTKEKKKCAPCSAGLQNEAQLDPIDKLATLGRRTQVQPFMPVQRSIFEGAPVNFVNTSSGHLAFAVTDLELAGAMPLMFQRVYSSDRNEDTGLGAGWSFVFDDRITLENDKATMRTGNGAVILFRRDAGSSRFRLQVDAPFPHQSFDLLNEDTISEQVGGLTRTYIKVGNAYRLSRIADANGNSITISFDAGGHMMRVESSGGGVFVIEWSDDAEAHLLSVRDNTGRRVAFKQDGKRLRAVTDPAGAQWSYDYVGAQLTRASDLLNRTLLRVRYDKTGRAVEAGDAADTYLYDYGSANASRLTTVTDPLGAKTYFEHSESGMLTIITDGEGRSVRFEYNVANRPVRVSNSFGDETKLSYDAENRLVRHWSTDGTDKAYGYDERGRINSVTEVGVRTDYTLNEGGQITAAKSSDSKRNYSASYNGRGQLASLKSDNREVSFEYDRAGNKTAFVYSDVGRFTLERDGAGRIVKESLPSGLNTYNEYDARGWLSKRSDNRGRSMRVERDESGATVAFVRGDGKRMTAVRDEAGRVVAVTDFNGGVRRFTYNARGALTNYADEKGNRLQYEYDKQGRLHSISDDNGRRLLSVERDERGRVRRLLTSNSTKFGRNSDYSLAHPFAQQDIDIGEVGVVNVTDTINTWQYTPVNGGMVGSDGSMAMPMESAGYGEGGGGQTCEQCIAREQKVCALNFTAELSTGLAGGFIGLAACLGLFAIPPPFGEALFVACGFLVVGAAYNYFKAAEDRYKACQLGIDKTCASNCPAG